MRGLFVTGTDTGVGKTILAAAICAALAERGERVAAFKPVITGLDDPPGDWPHDHELLASVANAGQSPNDVAPAGYNEPSPAVDLPRSPLELLPRVGFGLAVPAEGADEVLAGRPSA